jgi:NADH-quinone oxidoreductase subunit N
VVSYVLTTLASFGVILMLSRKGFESDELADFAGLGKRNPMLAMVMAACMFSLAGIPPFVGFYAKLTVLKSLMLSGQAFFIGLAVFAVIMSLIATFYYLRVVKVMFFDEPTQVANLEASPQAMGLLMVNGMALLLLGLFPSGLLQVCRNAMASIVF